MEHEDVPPGVEAPHDRADLVLHLHHLQAAPPAVPLDDAGQIGQGDKGRSRVVVAGAFAMDDGVVGSRFDLIVLEARRGRGARTGGR